MGRLGIFFLLVGALPAQNPFAGNATEADAGRGLFRIMCGPCHGYRAQGGRGPDLTIGSFSNGGKDEDLFRVISYGVAGTEMPGYAARVTPDNIWRMIAYIRTISTRPPETPPGDRAAGEMLFWGKGGCGACHRVGQRGGPMGPELTRAGRKRSLAYLRQSITDPNADVTPGYYQISVTPAKGQKIVGTQRGFDNFTCQVMTPNGQLHSFDREDASCDRDMRSMMPAYTRFSQTELNDLLSYLMSLRGEGSAQ